MLKTSELKSGSFNISTLILSDNNRKILKMGNTSKPRADLNSLSNFDIVSNLAEKKYSDSEIL